MRYAIVLLWMLSAVPWSFASDKDNPARPIAWGMLAQNTGCVIFEEGHKTKGMFWGVAVTAKVSGKLTVLETQNYTMDQKELLETQENMDSLMERAQTDHVKYVKIPEKHSPELLERARAMCQ